MQKTRPAATSTPASPVRRKLLAAAIAQAIAVVALPGHSATITVNNAGDVTAPGACTLRDAIASANTDTAVAACVAGDSQGGTDTIVFDPSILPGTIALGGSDLLISSAMSIQGPGLDQLTISGEGASRVFYIDDGDVSAVTVTLEGLTIFAAYGPGFGGGIFNREDLTIEGSALTGNSATSRGGGLYNGATATLTNSTVSDNSADLGGGIFDLDGTLTVIDSILSGNSATGSGGGIFNDGGPLTLTNSTLTGNTADDSGGGLLSRYGIATLADSTLSGNTAARGGGLSNSGSAGTANLTNTTVTSNNAAAAGGGVENVQGGLATLTDSTVSGNSASTGGGLYNYNGTATLTNSTLAGNTVDNFGGGLQNLSATATLTNTTVSGNSARFGGGLFNRSSDVSLTNSTLSGNTAGQNGGGLNSISSTVNLTNSILANSIINDCFNYAGSLIETNLNNLIQDGSCPDNAVNPITGDPLLGPLRNNGGATLTHALLVGSPAIDAGDGPACPMTDQRGFSRDDGECDVGAFELDGADPDLLFLDGFE